MSPKKNKKARKIILIIASCLIAVFILSLVINSIVAHRRWSEIKGAYGEYCQTSHGRINYSVIGDKGDTIVILPGQGSVSPHYEFLSLAERLAKSHKIIIIEPLGYGLSDDTDIPRTAENICNEIHEVLSDLGENRYYLLGHSIAGLYIMRTCSKTSLLVSLVWIHLSRNRKMNVIGISELSDLDVTDSFWWIRVFSDFLFWISKIIRMLFLRIRWSKDPYYNVLPVYREAIKQLWQSLFAAVRRTAL